MKFLSFKWLIAGGALIIGLASTYVFKMKHDNPVEEAAEVVIKGSTGVHIDLTFDSPEKEEDSDGHE